MSFGSAVFSSGPIRDTSRPEEENGLFDQLTRASHFLRDIRYRLRHGELSRAPLRMLRFQVADATVECDWLARAADPWDADLSPAVRQRHASLQAIKDALRIRVLLFDAFPKAESAEVRVFRESEDYRRELIISGYLHRNDNTGRQANSIIMRAKVLGFQFRMEDDILREI
jgi:hypothetical protein